MKNLFNPDLDGMEVKESQLLVATADEADSMIDEKVIDLLKVIRVSLKMDVVFVSEFVGGERVFRFVDAGLPLPGIEPNEGTPLEESWCQRVVDGRLPECIPRVSDLPPGSAPLPSFDIGTHLSVPVRLGNGEVYGTLCCFSHAPVPTDLHSDLNRLRAAANLIGVKMDQARAKAIVDPWHRIGEQLRR